MCCDRYASALPWRLLMASLPRSLHRSLSKVGAVAWLPIVICFSIIVGLGLDYDVFLVSRVLEERLDGYTDRASLVR